MKSSSYSDILHHIQATLDAARTVFARFTPGAIETEYKAGHDPVTEADRALDAVLRQKQFEKGPFKIQAMGSVAYKLARVAAGLADVSFTLTPKNEWDIVAGAALVQSAGGFVSTLEKTDLTVNRRDPLLSGLLASGTFLKDQLLALVEPHIRVTEAG